MDEEREGGREGRIERRREEEKERMDGRESVNKGDICK